MDSSRPRLNLDLLFDDAAHGALVRQLAWRPGARQLVGLWEGRWWLFDAAGEKTLLARPDDFGVDDADAVAELRWSADGRRLVVVSKESFGLFDVDLRRRLPLARGVSEVRGRDPKLSADGRRLAFVRDADLYTLDIAGGEESRLTTDGEPGVVVNGATDWVYWEELWGRKSTGHWWSPDGSRLAYYHFDDRGVPVYPLVDTRPLYPEVESQRYPKAGEALPRVEVRVVHLDSGRTVRLETGTEDGSDAYLARVHWHPDGERLAVERLDRRQARLDLLLCDSGDGSGRVLAADEQPAWINLGNELVFLAGGRFLWSTEETGWRTLYLYEADGRSRRRLTPEGWALVALDAVNELEGWFVFSAHSTGPLGAAERHVFHGDLGRSEPPQARRLTEEPGWHAATASSLGPWVDQWSDAATPPRQTIRHLDETPAVALPGKEPSYDVTRLPRWERLTIPGPGGVELPAQIMKPAGFDPGRRYPVLTYHYGCPGSQVVENRWLGGQRFLWHTMMAERGFVVFSVDNEASLFFGKRGEDKIHRRFGEIELAAQLAGVDYLAGLPWVDVSRIGLWGWSGGGAATLYCLARRPGVWKAGMSGAPVTDWRYYDAVWIERYLGCPRDNEEGYEHSAPLTWAADLADELLLVHGTADDNVHPQNTINLVEKLIEAGARFELALYPNAKHSLDSFTEKARRHLFERMTAFFDRHLGPS